MFKAAMRKLDTAPQHVVDFMLVRNGAKLPYKKSGTVFKFNGSKVTIDSDEYEKLFEKQWKEVNHNEKVQLEHALNTQEVCLCAFCSTIDFKTNLMQGKQHAKMQCQVGHYEYELERRKRCHPLKALMGFDLMKDYNFMFGNPGKINRDEELGSTGPVWGRLSLLRYNFVLRNQAINDLGLRKYPNLEKVKLQL